MRTLNLLTFDFNKITSMTPETIFQLCNTIALLGWLLLILASPFWEGVNKMLIGIIITLFAIVYAWLALTHFSLEDMKSFGSLEGVMNLFQDKNVVTAGWVHYLAFDLMTGIWIKKNSMHYGINQWLILPCLIFTFMLGPVGLLLYLLIRWAVTRQYFAEY